MGERACSAILIHCIAGSDAHHHWFIVLFTVQKGSCRTVAKDALSPKLSSVTMICTVGFQNQGLNPNLYCWANEMYMYIPHVFLQLVHEFVIFFLLPLQFQKQFPTSVQKMEVGHTCFLACILKSFEASRWHKMACDYLNVIRWRWSGNSCSSLANLYPLNCVWIFRAISSCFVHVGFLGVAEPLPGLEGAETFPPRW